MLWYILSQNHYFHVCCLKTLHEYTTLNDSVSRCRRHHRQETFFIAFWWNYVNIRIFRSESTTQWHESTVLYLHLFSLNITWNLACSHLTRGMYKYTETRAHTPAAIVCKTTAKKKVYFKTMYLVCALFFPGCFVSSSSLWYSHARMFVCAKYTRRRKTIENNKEQPLKQHAEPVSAYANCDLKKLFSFC